MQDPSRDHVGRVTEAPLVTVTMTHLNSLNSRPRSSPAPPLPTTTILPSPPATTVLPHCQHGPVPCGHTCETHRHPTPPQTSLVWDMLQKACTKLLELQARTIFSVTEPPGHPGCAPVGQPLLPPPHCHMAGRATQQGREAEQHQYLQDIKCPGYLSRPPGTAPISCGQKRLCSMFLGFFSSTDLMLPTAYSLPAAGRALGIWRCNSCGC